MSYSCQGATTLEDYMARTPYEDPEAEQAYQKMSIENRYAASTSSSNQSVLKNTNLRSGLNIPTGDISEEAAIFKDTLKSGKWTR